MRDAIHRARGVAFVVEAIGDERYGAARGDFSNEDNAAADLAADLAADVESQVDFREVRVERDGNAEEADALELEANDADVRLAVEKIGLGSGRGELSDDVGRDGEI